MSEWWTYTLADFLLFSPQTYYRLFELYNRAIWPAHLLAIAGGVAILVLWFRANAWGGRAIAGILAACWLWVAWAYLFERYDTINWAARYFAIAFVLQAALLIWVGVIRNTLVPQPRPSAVEWAALTIFAAALLLYPFLPWVLGRPLVQAEVFGLAPDPTAIGTLGVLLAAERVRWSLLPIPLLWCALSGATLWAMEVPDTWLLPGLAALSLMLACAKSTRGRSASTQVSNAAPDRIA
jgi:hypothetical protein